MQGKGAARKTHHRCDAAQHGPRQRCRCTLRDEEPQQLGGPANRQRYWHGADDSASCGANRAHEQTRAGAAACSGSYGRPGCGEAQFEGTRKTSLIVECRGATHAE